MKGVQLTKLVQELGLHNLTPEIDLVTVNDARSVYVIMQTSNSLLCFGAPVLSHKNITPSRSTIPSNMGPVQIIPAYP